MIPPLRRRSVAVGPEAASGVTFVMLFLPYVSSGFVPTETMPGVLHAFAEHQPITPIVETLRGLIMGTSTGGNGPLVEICEDRQQRCRREKRALP